MCVSFYLKGKGVMETYWLEGRQDMGEANETMVCLWRPKKKKSSKIQQKSVSTDTNTASNQLHLGNQENDTVVNSYAANNQKEHLKTERRVSSSGSSKSDISKNLNINGSAENSSTTENSHLEKYDDGKLMTTNSARNVNIGQHRIC